MLKKFFVIAVLSAVVVASIATVCLAAPNIQSTGCNHGHNGSYYFEQAWAKAKPTGSNYNITVYISNSSGASYSPKTTKAYKNMTTTCYSQQHQEAGGTGARVEYSATT